MPFYVWDFSERFKLDVVDDFVAEYAAGRTPNPCLRCNEKIKFSAVLDKALALGFDAVVTGHHARLGPDGLLRRSVEEYGQTIVMVTHDARAAAVAHRVLFLADGEIVRELDESNQREILAVMEEVAAA